ncbi:MAG: aspartyl protease family protein [Acidobacteria bacterium]|nr:aspartyl protease family protein [Acidobacteriota bacterium]
MKEVYWLRQHIIDRSRFTGLVLCFLFIISSAGFAFEADIYQVLPGSTKKIVKQADKLLRQGKLTEAESFLKRAAEAHPDDSAIRLRVAYLHLKQRRTVDAYNISLGIAQAEEKNSYAYAILGSALLSAGRFPQARQILVNAIQLNRKESLAWASLGLLEFYENNIDEGILNMREAVYLEPNHTDHVFSLAQALARSEQYKEAARGYIKYLAISRGLDDERRARIKGLIDFMEYLGGKHELYAIGGAGQTTIPIRIVGNRPVLQIRVNGRSQPLNFVLDSGSGATVISKETADLLSLKPVARGGHAKGFGGDGRFEIVYGFVNSIEIGEVKVRNVPVYIRHFHSQTNKIDGYIGLSLVSKFLTTIDYGESTFGLMRKETPEAETIRSSGTAIPLRLTSSGFLSGEVRVEGVEDPLNFIVDTGSSVSVISDDLARLDPVSSFAGDAKMRVIGAAGIEENVPSYILPKVSFGPLTRSDISAISLDLDTINTTTGFEQAGILGGNFLRNYRMTFDFKNSLVIFVPIDAQP